MSIETFIKRVCVQTAVYWGGPTPDGYGGLDFDDPVEISVRWDDSTELITTADGTQYACRAKVLVTQDVDLDGYLYLGELDDLDSEDYDDPKSVDNVYRIRRFDKVPMIRKTDEFVRTVYL